MRFGRNFPLRSLRARLLAAFVAGMALSAVLVAVGVLLLAKPFREYTLRDSIEGYAERIARLVKFDAAGRPVGFDETKVERWTFVTFGSDVLFRVLDEQGRVAFALDPAAAALAPDGQGFDPLLRVFALTRAGVAMHASTVPLMHEGRPWYVQFSTSDRLMLRMRQAFGVPALWRGVAATCATFLAVWLVTMHLTLRHTLSPLREASAAAQRITPRSLDGRLDAALQPDEIRPLVEAFNQTLDRLEQGFRTQQEFLSSAAHELKTPLALIRAQVERSTADDRRRLLLGDVDQMARQVQQLLMLAEVSERQNFRIEPIDPRTAIQEVFDYMSRVAERRGVYIGLQVSPDIRRLQADRGALFTLLKNLLENAIQHSPEGGIVTLTLDASGLSVRDQGPGVEEAHLARIFDRFWRGAGRRETGAGLGLAICREIALAHGWRLQARNLPQGLEVAAATSS